jgi:hypothetical protein
VTRVQRWFAEHLLALAVLGVLLFAFALCVAGIVAVQALGQASDARAQAACNGRLIAALTGDTTLPNDKDCSVEAVRKLVADRALDKARITQLEQAFREKGIPLPPRPTLSPVPGSTPVVVVPRLTPTPQSREVPRTGPTTSRRPSAARTTAPASSPARPSPRPSTTRTPRPATSCVVTLPPLVGLPTCVKG